MKISVRQLALFGVGVAILFISAICSYENSFLNICIAFFTLVLCIINLWKSRDNVLEFILHIQLFYYNYSVVFSRYLYIVQDCIEFYQSTNERVMGIGIITLFLFELCMTFSMRKTLCFSDELIYSKESNQIFGIGLLGVCFAIGILGFDWGSYGNRGTVASYYEYMGILLLLGLHYSGSNKSKLIKIGYSLLIIILVLQGFVYGERVSALQFMFIWLFYFLGKKIKASHIVIFCILGIVLMTAVGIYRNSYDAGRLTLEILMDTVTERLFTFNGADLAYYCSLTFVMVADKVSWIVREDMFMRFIQSVFVGEFAESHLPTFTRQYYWHWFGGYFPLYFYFYGGIVGVITACLAWSNFMYKCLSGMLRKHKEFFYLLGVYSVCIAARWYMYSPLLAIRPLLLFAIAYFGLHYVNKMIRK